MLITILAFLGVLALLILAHEVGHFATAKAFKIKVEEFGLGFPPRLVGFKRGETLYSLNAIPLGGFTKMAGEEDPKIPRSFASKSIGTRLIVLVAGSIMNLILPIVLFTIAFAIPHQVVIEPTLVKAVSPGSPAALAGIQAGDLILELNDKAVNNFGELQRAIQLNLGKEITMMLEHSNQAREEVRLIPRWKPPPGEGAIGIERDVEFALANRKITTQQEPLGRAIMMAASECVEVFILIKNEVLKWVIGAATPQVTGPVGIAQFTGEAARAGAGPLLELTGFISINLAILNLLPLPALDGGRIAFVLIELVRRGKRVSPKTEGLVHLIGFAMLMALILVITYQDIIRIIG